MDDRNRVGAFSAALFIVLSGCQRVAGFEEFAGPIGTSNGGSAGTSSDVAGASSQAGDVGCTLPPQVIEHGPTMVSFESAKSKRGCTWIDATEVTKAQYAEFLADGSNPNVQADVCLWNIDFAASASCSDDTSIASNSAMDSPVVCVDQCDAKAFCAWAGKRLCEGDWATGLKDPTKSEWYDACSSGGQREYPYSSSYVQDACNDAERTETGCSHGACTTTSAGSLSSCITPFGAFDLTGNVSEWVSECGSTVGMSDKCRARGGAFNASSADAKCDVATDFARSYVRKTLGFRCCAG